MLKYISYCCKQATELVDVLAIGMLCKTLYCNIYFEAVSSRKNAKPKKTPTVLRKPEIKQRKHRDQGIDQKMSMFMSIV